ncbi:MAG: response regulator [bacterium]
MRVGKICVEKEKDILIVRHTVKILCERLGMGHIDCIRVATAASELTRSLYQRPLGGEITFTLLEEGGRMGLKMVFEERDKNSENVRKGLDDESLSMDDKRIGLERAKMLMDEVEIASKKDGGAMVTCVKWLRQGMKLHKVDLPEIRQMFAAISEQSALDSLTAQNRELVDVLDELRKRNAQIEDVNRELEMTNAGIISLYQEIDKKNEELDLKNERKRDFMRAFGHETRTPLNSILSLSAILEKKIDGELSAEQEKQIAMIRESAQHMLTLVNDLLDLSRVEAGIIDLKISGIEIGELVHNASETIRPLAHEKGLSLKFEYEEGLPEIHTDYRSLFQVMLNLLSNAVKYTDRGEIKVIVQKMQKDNREYIRISVKDTGIGIPEDYTEKIFNEFVQVHVRDDIQKGSGLGLAITKRILDHLGGHITVESRRGTGTTFTVTLPVKFYRKKWKPRPLESEKMIPVEKETILIVEDDEKMIYALKKHLEAAGFKVLVARTPEKALSLASNRSIFAVCLDILLPDEKDGWMALKALKRNLRTSHIPIVVITILSEAEEKAKALEADEYMVKPIEMDELIDKLMTYKKTGKLETLLIVDDDEAEVKRLKQCFGNDYRILTAGNGKEAFEVLEKEEPDLIILDLIMPVMDGFEFLEGLRKKKRGGNKPVVVYTSKNLSWKEESILRKDTLEVINKGDITTKDFFMKVRKIFNLLRERGG